MGDDVQEQLPQQLPIEVGSETTSIPASTEPKTLPVHGCETGGERAHAKVSAGTSNANVGEVSAAEACDGKAGTKRTSSSLGEFGPGSCGTVEGCSESSLVPTSESGGQRPQQLKLPEVPSWPKASAKLEPQHCLSANGFSSVTTGAPDSAGTVVYDIVFHAHHETTMTDPSDARVVRGRLAALYDIASASDRTRHTRWTLGRAVAGGLASSFASDPCLPFSRSSPAPSASNSFVLTSGASSGQRAGSFRRQQSSGDSEGLNTWGVTCAVVNLILGNALFTIPYGFVLTGWFSIPLVVATTFLLCVTASLLGKSLEAAEDHGIVDPDYGVVGELAFGPRFRPVFVVLCAGECFFMCVFFLVYIAETAVDIVRLDEVLVIVGVAMLAVPLSLVPKRFLAFISVVGLSLTLGCTGVAMACGLGVEARNSEQTLFGTEGAAGAAKTAAFVAMSIADHPVFPSVYAAAKSPRAFQAGLWNGFLTFAISALSLGGVTYFAYGDDLRHVVLTNVGYDIHHRRLTGLVWLSSAVNAMIAVRAMLVLPAFVRPVVACIRDVVLHAAGWAPRRQLPCTQQRGTPMAVERAANILFLCVAFALCAVGAVFLADSLPDVETLTSALFKAANAIIIPCWSYQKLCGGAGFCRRRPLCSLVLWAVIFLGMGWAVGGTVLAVLGIASGTKSKL